MLGPKQEAQSALFYEFSLEDHVPRDHLLRLIDRFVDLSTIRAHLADFYSCRVALNCETRNSTKSTAVICP